MITPTTNSAERRQPCTTTIRSRRAQPRRVLDTDALYVPNGSKSHSELTWNHTVAVFTLFGLLMTALVSLGGLSIYGSSYRRRRLDSEGSQEVEEFTVDFVSHKLDPWGNGINFRDVPARWQYLKIDPGKQSERLGVKVGDRLKQVNGMELNERNKVQIKNILTKGLAAQISICRGYPIISTLEGEVRKFTELKCKPCDGTGTWMNDSNNGFHEGDKVEGFYSKGGRWYGATVGRHDPTRPNKIHLLWDDGSQGFVKAESVRLISTDMKIPKKKEHVRRPRSHETDTTNNMASESLGSELYGSASESVESELYGLGFRR